MPMKTKFWCESEQLDAASELFSTRFPANAATVLAQANRVCENTFLFSDHWEMERTQVPVQFEGAIDWAHIPANDPEWLYAMNRHTSFVNLGKAYRCTKDVRYAQHFARLISDWIDRVPLTQESASSTWRSLEAGLRCETWLRCLALFEGSAALTAELKDKIDGCLTVHAKYLAATSNDFHRLSNWGVLQDHGLLLLGIYFGVDEHVNLAAQRLDAQLHLQVLRDGSHWEQSPMYHCEVLHCAIDALLVARQNGIELPPRFVNNVHQMCKALAAWNKPNGRLFCQSDSDDTDARDIVAQGALLFEDGSLKVAANGMLFEENIWDFGPDVYAQYAKIAELHEKCASTALPDSGNYVLRGDASTDAAYLHFHCGCLGSGHGHADLLHIDAGMYGEDMLIDSGRYTYVNTPLRRQLKLPAAHNTTRVDGVDFSTCIDSWGYDALAQPIKGEYTFETAADYVSGLHLGYMSLASGAVLTGRKIVFIKPNIFVIFDQFYARGAHEYEQNFHFGAGKLTTAEHNTHCHWQSEKASGVLLCLGDALAGTMSRAPYSRDYNALLEGDVLTVTQKGDGFASFITVLALDGAEQTPQIAARIVPVTTVRMPKLLPAEKAQAVEITSNGQSYTVLMCSGETVSEVELLRAGEREGYGKAIVFTPESPDGVCLAW